MAGPQHQTPAYRAARKAIQQAQARGQWLTCMQPECVMPSRDIPPTMRAFTGHDDSGNVVVGPVHAKCNARDGAIRGNKMRAKVKAIVRRRVL